MPVNDTLTPMEASYIATNAYFTLKDWINGTPKAAVERRPVVANRVLGPGNMGKQPGPGQVNPTLGGSSLQGGQLGQVFSASTGIGTQSGFGYVLHFDGGGQKHAIVATRGTRPELGAPDLLTDLRASLVGFGSYGPVHKGFKRTFDSIAPGLAGDKRLQAADVVHCVGHSLGGAVATLVAAQFAGQGKKVKLYTFGSPRVGALAVHSAMEREIGAGNIYRVAHDLDPITLIGPFPYVHVNPAPGSPNFMTIPSPTGQLFSTANHDMMQYISSVGDADAVWEDAMGLSGRVDHDNAVLARWLLHQDNDPGWVQYASAKTLALLFKLFAHVLRAVSTSVVLSLTAVDLISEILLTGMHKVLNLAGYVYDLMCHAARWAGIELKKGADFTASILQRILLAMTSRLRDLAAQALSAATRGLSSPLPLVIGGAWALQQALPL